MGIEELSIKGFRSLRDVTWRPGKLNVVIGPNGSGKSNLLQAIGLLSRAASGHLPDVLLRMGGIAPLLWDRRTQEIEWTVRLTPVALTPEQDEQLTYELGLRQLGSTSSYRIDHERLIGQRLADNEGGSAPKIHLERTHARATIFGTKVHSLEVHDDALAEEESLLSFGAGPVFPVVMDFVALLRGWSLYHEVHVGQSAALRQAAVARMERRVAVDGQNLIPVLHTLYTGSREFKRIVDDAMRAAFSTDYEELVFPPAADQRVQLRVRWRSLRTEQSAADLSDGTIRFLLLLAILADPDPPDLIAFDEPETGLHPSMLPIVAEHAADAARRTQVILTTHSAQLLDAFTAAPPTTTVAKWEDGETRLSVLDGEELARWLQEYTLGALFRSGELEGMA